MFYRANPTTGEVYAFNERGTFIRQVETSPAVRAFYAGQRDVARPRTSADYLAFEVAQGFRVRLYRDSSWAYLEEEGRPLLPMTTEQITQHIAWLDHGRPWLTRLIELVQAPHFSDARRRCAMAMKPALTQSSALLGHAQ